MNLCRLLQQRAEARRPIKIGVIGAGKFATMFLAQVRLTPGMYVAGIAELDPEKARQACLRAGWPEDVISFGDAASAIDHAAQIGKTALTVDANHLIKADLDVIIEITGVPEAGAYHAWSALEAGKHVIMVNVEADALLGQSLKKKAG